jgi:hypothetical protein
MPPLEISSDSEVIVLVEAFLPVFNFLLKATRLEANGMKSKRCLRCDILGLYAF